MSTWRVSRVMLALVLLGVGQRVYGGNATWLGTSSSDWLDSTNWLPQTVPNGSSDVAAFGVSTRTTVNDTQTSSAIVLSGITFNAGASAYTITGVPGASYTLSGAGVTNNSLSTQTFTNTASTNSGTLGTQLIFQNSATAANAVINNNSATVAGGRGTQTTFSGTSTAGTATITNGGYSLDDGFANGGFGFGSTLFTGSSSAGYATITSNGTGVDGGTSNVGVIGGETNFDTNATADHATFIINGATAAGGIGGEVNFGGNSTAANGTFTVNAPTASGSQGSFAIQFGGTATAGSAVFTINGGLMNFSNTSTAGNAAITNNASSEIEFSGFSGGTPSAGNATITNNPGAAGGASSGSVTAFSGGATAANSTIMNNGGTTSGAMGGSTQFGFNGNPTAGNATLIANGGTNGGLGGTIILRDDSLGGTSRIEVFGNGSLNISNHNGGVTVGSIEGDGKVFLGSGLLTVGSSNASTIFAGAIQNGPTSGGGGSLTKIGSGTLTLSGASTYTGETVINEGKLIINGSIDSPEVLLNSGGTLGGSGTINGIVYNSGGTVAPGDPTTLHVNGDYEQDVAVLRIVIDGPTSLDKLAITGDLYLYKGAILELDFTNGFAPTMGEQFDFLTYGGVDYIDVGNGFPGNFSQVNIVGLEPGFQYDVQPDGSGNFGLTANNDGVSTSVPEPASLAIVGMGGLMLMRRKRLPRSPVSSAVEI